MAIRSDGRLERAHRVRLIGEIDAAERARLLALTNSYRWDHCDHVGNDDFWMLTFNKRAYICIKPGGRIHLHTDEPPHNRKTHTVLSTNDQCVSRMGGVDFHLELGGIYAVDASVPHESFNGGTTDRIHLVETLETRDGKEIQAG